jgi:hypothetical protein
MSANAWFNEFRYLHEKAKKKDLNESEKGLYLAAREQFARALTAAQGLTLKPGESARQAFRVAQAMQVELSFGSGMVRAVTQDLSRGGLSVTIAQNPDPKESVGFSLRMPGGTNPLVGRAKAVSAKKQPGNYRVSFAFEGLSEADQERLELILFDAALARIPS